MFSLFPDRRRPGIARWRRPAVPSRRRSAALVAAGAAGVVTALALLTGLAALGLRGDVQGARAELEGGRDQLLAGDAGDAARAFRRSEAGFLRAQARLEGPLLRAAGGLPGLADDRRALVALTGVGSRLADAGLTLALGIREAGGLPGLAPTAQGVPVAGLAALQRPLAQAARAVDDAAELLATVPAAGVAAPLAAAREELGPVLAESRSGLRAAAALAGVLPGLLGEDGPRRYFLGASNPAELRGTGGFVGAYAVLEAERGRISVSPFNPIQALPNLAPDEIPAPSAEFAARQDRYGGAGFWLNLNLTRDFPTAAAAMVRLYAAVTGEQLDGVILVDPFALEALLHSTGPVDVPGVGAVGAGDVVRVVTQEAYSLFSDNEQRKRVLGDVATGVLSRFLDEPPGDLRALGAALAAATADGHVLVHSTEPALQRRLSALGVTGALPSPRATDLLAVTLNNAAGNKLDYYLQPTVGYAVRLQADGSAEAAASVHLHNGAPPTGLGDYVYGTDNGVTSGGENVTLVSVTCALGCGPASFLRDGLPVHVAADRESGHPVHSALVRLPAGAAQELRGTWIVPRAWSRSAGAGGTYRLQWRGQPTVRPGKVVITVALPPGTRADASAPRARITRRGGVETLRWVLDGVTDKFLEVTFRPE